MPFPQVAAVNGGNNTTPALEHTVNLPADIAANDLLLVFFASLFDPVITFPEGWTELFQDETGNNIIFGCWYRIADGEEGATISVSTSEEHRTAHTSYRITGYAGIPEVGISAGISSANPNPPNLIPTWGFDNTLWFAATGYAGNSTVSDYPTNYTDGRNDYADNAAGCGVGTARRELKAASEDPDTFTLNESRLWVANTLGIRGKTTGPLPLFRPD